MFVVTTGYERIRFDDRYSSALANLVVHAVPHDTLKSIDQSTILPEDGKTNIFTAHGVAGGSELFFRAQGREYAIDEDTLLRGWDYGALGHWHKQGPVTVGASGKNDRIWYAGSTENMGWRDLRDNHDKRGYLQIELDETDITVTPAVLPTRTMFRLPVIDAAGKTADEIVNEMLDRVRGADIDGAVVGQIVDNVPRDLWSLVDIAKVRAAAEAALHYEVTTRYVGAVEVAAVNTEQGLGELETVISSKLKTIPETYREPVGEKVRNLVTAYRAKFEGDAS